MSDKEWELETRIKRLEGNDLESIVNEFNDKIDGIFNKACAKLDSLLFEFKIRDSTQKKKKMLEYHMKWVELKNRQEKINSNLSALSVQNNLLDQASNHSGLQSLWHQSANQTSYSLGMQGSRLTDPSNCTGLGYAGQVFLHTIS